MTVKEIAQEWGVCERTVRNYCEKGYILGAVKKGRQWLIPDNYPQPYLSRKKKFSRPSEKSNYVLFAIEAELTLDFRLLALDQTEFKKFADKLISGGFAEKADGAYQLTQAGLDRCEEIRGRRKRKMRDYTAMALSATGTVSAILPVITPLLSI